MIDINQVTRLFQQYGYKIQKEEYNKYLVFELCISMYPAVEIVPLCKIDKDELKKLKNEYSIAGYAVRICDDENIENIDKYLFDLFFQVEASNKRMLLRYNEYIDGVMQSYDECMNPSRTSYKYIEIAYKSEVDFKLQLSSSVSLVDSIINNLKQEGPQLIIVEAAAGFGKTSTAFEVLYRIINESKNIRPFFMELSKDRRASTFQYLLVNQIDRDFNVKLESNLVIENIKKGRIPLIIDGFDELLSQDMDNGSFEINHKKVDSMLSTIADLLTSQTKIILTSRKTAIFAGEAFYDWYLQYENKGQYFHIIRYQLEMPTIEDWLSTSRISKLPRNFGSISNPVILGYLRYLSDEDFKTISTAKSLTSKYFESILKREQDRQDLPFTVSDQTSILRKIAIIFAGFDINAMSRTDLKNSIFESSQTLIEEHSTKSKSADKLSNSLTNHAFFDRKNETQIGFINDFVYGTFLMYAIKDERNDLLDEYFKSVSYSFLEKAILSCSVFDDKTKIRFWESLIKRCRLNEILRFWSDILLRGTILRSYDKISLDGKVLSNIEMGNREYKITNCTFANINFNTCFFDFDSITNCTFINCTFQLCEKIGVNFSCDFFGCSLIPDLFIDETQDVVEDIASCEYNILIDILQYYFQVGSRKPRMRMVSKLKENFDSKEFKRAFNYLEKNNFIVTNGDKTFIQPEGINYYNEHKK